ncbi:ferrous iron transport protein B [Desulfotignum balticum]|jgi:ferrous iron transport protein B|uniref:ferrous iron transport protein B n=1 Tax=Desulfotignum balticum TaxID=115781 RepID=UPI000401B01C|nr:ferrous iron transport protein B [Desulfotignum balticum]
MGTDKIIVALAGQPNCGKSTVFNALTGARQHVANYPGVTVEKMTGWYRYGDVRVTVVDLPGTYSLTSYSPEERVTRDFILHQAPSVVVNTMDASNLKRCLYLTFQLMEMEIPVILNLNMMDVAQNRGMTIDTTALSRSLGVPVVPTAITRGKGKTDLQAAILEIAGQGLSSVPARVDYREMTPYISSVQERVTALTDLGDRYPVRWLAIKLMEGDEAVRELIREKTDQYAQLLLEVDKFRQQFKAAMDTVPDMHVATCRYRAAEGIARPCVTQSERARKTLSDRIDALVCHKLAGPVFMVGVLWTLYYLSIVQGYQITNYTWPLLAGFRNLVSDILPVSGFIDVPLTRAFFLWLVDSVNALLNYIPIFFILFACIAFLEDSGYMPRMAFIMDRLFSRYGLHGQSTLPMVLGGIYVGGCAVPGVMSCKGIPDERSRLATILIIPMLNCLAKVPLYVLLINIYFAPHKGWAMFFISTISMLMVLPVSKLLTLTVLKDKETAPFVMEMPPYHLPTVRGVLGRALERVWLFIRKITTIVVALAVVIFVLLQFPGIGPDRMAQYETRKHAAVRSFYEEITGTGYEADLADNRLMAMIHFWENFRNKKMRVKSPEAAQAIDTEFEADNARFFSLVKPGRDREAKQVNRALKTLIRERSQLLQEMRAERINNSFLGYAGKALVPLTQWAGFNWRVNVALLGAFAAKESAVATLGALYEQGDASESLESRMARGEQDFTPLHALALMMFMVLYPPCLATAIAVKLQSGSVKWMLFAMGYPMLLGLVVASLIFTGGSLLGLSGLQAMAAFYLLALAITIAAGFITPARSGAT